VASRKKVIRSDKESGPVRISDHIYEWFIGGGEQLLAPSEVDFIERWEKVFLCRDLSVYKNKDGEDYPEIWNGIKAMFGYQKESENQPPKAPKATEGPKQWFDL
jgi:hypothetical protein